MLDNILNDRLGDLSATRRFSNDALSQETTSGVNGKTKKSHVVGSTPPPLGASAQATQGLNAPMPPVPTLPTDSGQQPTIAPPQVLTQGATQVTAVAPTGTNYLVMGAFVLGGGAAGFFLAKKYLNKGMEWNIAAGVAGGLAGYMIYNNFVA